jgi:Ras-related protein Rab-5C
MHLVFISQVKELQRRGDPNMIIALAGNKTDLVARRKVDAEVRELRGTSYGGCVSVFHTQEASEYAKELNLMYIETSAKDASNVEKLFSEVARRVPKTVAAPKKDVVQVKQPNAPAGGGKGSCC